jgi:hypothetical protein
MAVVCAPGSGSFCSETTGISATAFGGGRDARMLDRFSWTRRREEIANQAEIVTHENTLSQPTRSEVVPLADVTQNGERRRNGSSCWRPLAPNHAVAQGICNTSSVVARTGARVDPPGACPLLASVRPTTDQLPSALTLLRNEHSAIHAAAYAQTFAHAARRNICRNRKHVWQICGSDYATSCGGPELGNAGHTDIAILPTWLPARL